MTMPAPATWHVNGAGITQGTDLAPNGTGLVDFYSVPFTIDTGPAAGHSGVVKVPASSYSRETVTAAIQASVDSTHAVAGLTG